MPKRKVLSDIPVASKVPHLEDSLVQINDHLLAIVVVQAYYEGRNGPESMIDMLGSLAGHRPPPSHCTS